VSRRRAILALTRLQPADRRLALQSLTADERRALEADWPSWAHEGQIPPDED
jgi:hypothetical protein